MGGEIKEPKLKKKKRRRAEPSQEEEEIDGGERWRNREQLRENSNVANPSGDKAAICK